MFARLRHLMMGLGNLCHSFDLPESEFLPEVLSQCFGRTEAQHASDAILLDSISGKRLYRAPLFFRGYKLWSCHSWLLYKKVMLVVLARLGRVLVHGCPFSVTTPGARF